MPALTDRQNEIIEATIRIISRKGIQEFTIRNLSRELGISEPAIYRHFESKTDILTALLEFVHADTIAIFDQVSGEGPALAQLEQYFSLLFSRLQQRPAVAAVVFSDEAFLNEERLAATVRALVELTIDNTTGLLTRAQENGEIPTDVDEHDLATLLSGGVRLLVRRWHMASGSWNLCDRGSRVIQTFIRLIDIRT